MRPGFGNENSTKTPSPIQPRVGIYDEASLQRLDFILKTAADYGQRVILTLVNYEDGTEVCMSFAKMCKHVLLTKRRPLIVFYWAHCGNCRAGRHAVVCG